MTRVVPISTIVEGLRSFESGPITTSKVADFLADLRLDAGSIDRYARWRDERYTRHLIHRDDIFEVLLLCWMPGQRTPVHTHNGQLGWATVVRGGLEILDYTWKGCNKPENQNVVGIDCLAGATKVDLEPGSPIRANPGGVVGTVTKQQSIHQISCPESVGEPSASLHIYSKPIDSCVSFDLVHSRCGRRTLVYDTVDGVPVTTA